MLAEGLGFSSLASGIPSTKAMPRALAVIALLLGPLSAAAFSVAVEQSVDGTWTEAGTISLHGKGGGDVTEAALFNRKGGLPQAGLQQLVKQDSVYRLRVPSDPQQPDSSPKVVASIPARCWANDRWATPLTLHMLPGDRIGGLAFEMHCERGPAGSNSLAEAQALAALNVFEPPEEQYVQLRWPATAVPLRPSATGVFAGEVPGAAPQQVPAGSAAPPAGSQGQSRDAKGSEAGSEEGEKGPPPKDERTWLQKNWMLAMPLFMVAMNLLGNQLGGAASGAREREQARQGAAAGGRANARGR